MILDADSCYRAMCARDRRFDGVFFVAVETTGIYCRPICPARTPGRDRCTFFSRPAAAERAGFRACFRCRPELAPGLAAVDSMPRLAARAAARIEAGCLNEQSVDDLAASLGVSGRHLRRALEAELGVTAVAYAQSRRLALAKQLLHDTGLPIAEVAFASGFASLRRFNAAFSARFGRPPTALRRDVGQTAVTADFLTLRLDYRPPYDLDALLAFLAARALPGVETVAGGVYRREVVLGVHRGQVSVAADPKRPSLIARISLSLAPRLVEVVGRLRALFDLDARPDLVAERLGADPTLAPLVAARPGLRVPGAFDGFETALRAVLGQQVSVRAATTLAGRLVAHFDGVPAAATLAATSIDVIAGLGMPAARARTIAAIAHVFATGEPDLGGDPEAVMAALREVPGIGPWTAQYLAMRVLHWPDAFPAGDLGVKKALGLSSARAAEARAADWRPWRAYAVLHLWTGGHS